MKKKQYKPEKKKAYKSSFWGIRYRYITYIGLGDPKGYAKNKKHALRIKMGYCPYYQQD